MAQGGGRDRLDVIETDVESALDQGADFAGEDEGLAAAGTAAEAQILVGNRRGGFGLGMGRQDQADSVILHMRGHWHLAHEAHQVRQGLALEDFIHVDADAGGGAGEDLGQFTGGRVADQDLEEEAVELGLGQGIGSLLIDGVLGRHDEERFDEFAQLAAGGDLVFLHRFQQGRLGLGRRPVDFVGQDQVGEDGAALELELAPAASGLHNDVGAENVGGHQVGRELNAVEGEVEHIAQGSHQQGLAQARHALQEHVSPREQGDERAFDNGVLSDDDLADLRAQGRVGGAKGLNRLFCVHEISGSLKGNRPHFFKSSK